MTTTVHDHIRNHDRTTGAGRSRVPWWLALSVPMAVLAITASLVGILVDRVYARETAHWETQAVGQDVGNLIVFPLMLALASVAARGSRAALLAWLGTVTYAAYSYAIYVFDVHFGPLFLVYVGIFGLAVWVLIGGLSAVDPARVPVPVDATQHRFAAGLLVGTAVVFALLWLGEDLPPLIAGTTPDTLVETGLPTNAVHVLDLSLFLPAALLAGVQLARGRPWGQVLAPVVLVAMAAISAGIVALSVVAVARDQGGSLVVADVIGALGAAQAVTAWRLTGVTNGRRSAEPAPADDEQHGSGDRKDRWDR